MTANELTEMFSTVDLNSFKDEELSSVLDEMSTKVAEIKCILIRRKHLQIHHPLPKN